MRLLSPLRPQKATYRIVGEHQVLSRRARPAALALCALANTLLSCGGVDKTTGPGPSEPFMPTAATVTVSPDTISIQIGAQTTLVARARTSAGVEIGNAPIAWLSNDSLIATVNQAGSVSGKRFGPAIITAATSGAAGVVHIQVLAPTRDSTTISATDTTRVITGLGSSVTVAPNVGLSGQRLIVDETSPPAGTSNSLGPAIKVSVSGSLVALRASASASVSDLSFTVSTVTSVPSGTVAPGESRVAFLVSGGSPWATPSSPLLRLSDVETSSTSGTGAATITSSLRLTTAGSTPMLIVPTSAPPSCSQTDFPDGERLYRIRRAPASVGPAPFALILVHGWQSDQLTCGSASAWRPADVTWSTFLARFYPADGSPGEDSRLQLFDVWIAHYPSHRSIQSNGDALARLIAQQIPNQRIVVLAHSMGGLVTAAALRTSPALAIDTIVALGTPWRGSPIPGGLWILKSGWSCATVTGSVAGAVTAGVATLTEGSRGLSEASNGYLQTSLLSTINALAPRVTAVGGNIRGAHLNPTVDGQYLFYGFGDCVLKDLGYNASDGVVPTTSVSAEGQIRDVSIVGGLDHSQLYAVPGQSDPLRIAVDRFLAYLNHHAPVATVTVAPAAASIAIGGTQQFTTTLKDATGSTLTNRTVTWTSSSAIVTVNSVAGMATGVAAGTATLTATSEGKSGAGTLTVAGGGVAVLQPGPAAGSDVWITSALSYGSDYGVDDEKLQVGGWGDWYHTLIKFDVITLPSNALSAMLELQPYSRGDQSTPAQMTLSRVTSGWDENTGWFTKPSTSFERSLPAPVVGSTYSIDVTALYNGWKSGSIPNYGVELRPTGNNNEFNVFRSSDYLADPLLRPKLVVRLVADQQPGVASVTVSPATTSIAVGATQQFTATLKDASGNTLAGRTVVWSSSNPSVAAVNSSSGLATAMAPGSATITVTSEGKVGAATISVGAASRPAGSLLAFGRDSVFQYGSWLHVSALGVVDTAGNGRDYRIGVVRVANAPFIAPIARANFPQVSAVAECPNGKTYITDYSSYYNGVQLWQLDITTAFVTLLGEIAIGPNDAASMTCDANNALLVAGNFATVGGLFRVTPAPLRTFYVNEIQETYLGIAQSLGGLVYATIAAPFNSSSPQLLVTINASSGFMAAAGAGQQRQLPRVGRLEFRGNRLFGLSVGNLVEVNTSTGTVSVIRAFKLP